MPEQLAFSRAALRLDHCWLEIGSGAVALE
jgi:hypothetical protein